MSTHKEPLSNCCGAKPCGEIAYDNSGRCGECKEGCMFESEPTPPSQIEVDRLIKQARADQLKKLWNATQHDIVPEGTPPRDMSEELHKMIKELEEIK